MKTNGRIENWRVVEERYHNMEGLIFDFESPMYPDGSRFTMLVKTEPPYFKSRIVVTNIGNFYLLGEPADKEYEIV